MVAATLHWQTMDGVHRTAASSDKTVSVDIEAECGVNPAGEDGIDRVEFYVSVNGGAATTYSVTSRSQRTFNSTTLGPNGFAKLYAFGISVDCAALAGGTITVTASAFSGAATETAIATELTIYNDTDGVDRRPSSAIVYCDYDAGNDTTGNGTLGNPFKNWRAAMNSLSGDVGGATIRALGRTVSCTPSGSYSHSNIYTSGAWALNFEAVGSDKTFRRLTAGVFSDPQDYILGADTPRLNLRFTDFEFVGPGPAVFLSGPDCRVDEVNCLHRSHNWDGVRMTPHPDDEQYGSGGVSFSVAGGSEARIYSWGGRWRGVGRGPGAYSGLFDFSIGPFLGVAIDTSLDYGPDPCYTNGEVFGVRYTTEELPGLVQTNINFSQLAGVHVSITVQASGPYTGKMRIDATDSTPNDFGNAADGIVGSTRWGVKIENATSGANNGTFAVLEGGTNGSGRPYVILDNSSAVAETGSASLDMNTATLVGGNRYIDVFHTDVLQILASHTGAMFAHIRAFDCHNTRTWVGSGHTLTRCVFKNLTDGDAEGAFDFGSGSTTLADCLFFSLTTASPAVLFTGTFTGTEFVDCVWADGTNVPTTGTYIHSNHYIVDSAGGTGASTGSWFDSDPTASPFDYSPSSGDLDTASGLQDDPAFWRFDGATAGSRGAWRNVATGDWTVSANVTAEPGATTLVLTPYAPTVTAAGHRVLSPGSAPLVLTAFSPTIVATANQIVSPGAAALTLTRYAPTVTATSNIAIRTGTAFLTLTPFAPSVSAGATIVVSPGAASLTIEAFAPDVIARADVSIFVPAADLILQMFAPDVSVTTIQNDPPPPRPLQPRIHGRASRKQIFRPRLQRDYIRVRSRPQR